MEMKWKMYSERCWGHYLRCWTGYVIFSGRFEIWDDQLRMVEAWVSRDPQNYRGKDEDEAAEVANLYDLTDWIAR